MSRNYPAPFRGRGYPTMTNREIDQRALLIAKDAEIESFKEDRNRFTVILREKDAEIEQLKESAKYDAFLREKYRGLITELCDALEDGGPRPFALIQSAWEPAR